MKRFLLAAALACSAGAAAADGWKLVWSDEFDGPEVSDHWVFETGNGQNGWGNRELEFYQRENVRVEDGQLVITARRQDRDGFRYTSARMKTEGKKSFRYGRIEARIALPRFKGAWPAFWMLGDRISSEGWPACGEIDILEAVNGGAQIYGTAHWSAADGSKASYGGKTETAITEFHDYAVEWDKDFIRWLLDGRQYHEMRISDGVNGTGEFHEPFFLLINMAVGGQWPGFEVDEAKLPAEMRVDYVRVYEKSKSD